MKFDPKLGNRKHYSSIDQLIGQTPIISIKPPFGERNAKTLLLKLESFNPNFSVKDRTALGLVLAARSTGRLQPGGKVVESTSGNLGKSLAMLSAIMDFELHVLVDPKVSTHNINWYKAYGATVELVTQSDANGGYQKARIARVKEIIAADPTVYWPNQYDNPDNPDFHSANTVQEFLEVDFDVLAGAISTGGHMTGIARGLKALRPEKRVVACDVEGSAIFGEPFAPYLLNGVGLAWKSRNTDLSVFDECISVSDRIAISICRYFAQNYGILLGGSSGLVIFGALAALQSPAVNTAMALVADSGINYLDQIYDDAWLERMKVEVMTSIELDKAVTGAMIWNSDSQVAS